MSGVYSFFDVTATLAGITGVVDLGYGASTAEEGISINMSEDKNDMKIGCDGNVMHSLRCGKSGQIAVHLLKVSPAAKVLQNMYNAQTIGAAFHGQNVFSMKQTAAGDVIIGRMVAFKKCPDTSYAKDGDILTWTFDVGAFDIIRGQYPGI